MKCIRSIPLVIFYLCGFLMFSGDGSLQSSLLWHHACARQIKSIQNLTIPLPPYGSKLQPEHLHLYCKPDLSRKLSFRVKSIVTTRLESVHCSYSAIVQVCSCVLSLDLPRAASWYGLGGLYDCSGNCALSRRWRIGMSYSCMDIDRPRTGCDT